jgi:hypothetical protein
MKVDVYAFVVNNINQRVFKKDRKSFCMFEEVGIVKIGSSLHNRNSVLNE